MADSENYCFVDIGYRGGPRRKVNLKAATPELLSVCYVEEDVLWLILQATTDAQSDLDYEWSFEQFDEEGISREFSGTVEALDGGDRGEWSLKIPCVDWADEKIDKTIEAVLVWHNNEIRRISELPRPNYLADFEYEEGESWSCMVCGRNVDLYREHKFVPNTEIDDDEAIVGVLHNECERRYLDAGNIVGGTT